jgi:hypothetical protein
MPTVATPVVPGPLGLLNIINSWTLYGIAAVSVAEQTKDAESTSASKFQVAMDIIKNEAALNGQVFPELAAIEAPILTAVINGIVLVNNLKGLFKHAPKAPVAPAPAPALAA